MGLNLTSVYGRINDVKRNLHYGPDQILGFYDVNTLLLELDSNWFMQLGTTSNLAVGAEYFELSVVDVTEDFILDGIIPMASVVKLGDERYKILQYERPRGLTRQWNLRLESIGMRT